MAIYILYIPEKGDESQPLAGIFLSGLPPFLLLPATRSLFKAHYLYIYTYLYDTTCLHVPFFHTCPCFATLRHSFLGITPHPLASCLAPNPNGRCSPLSFGSLVFPYACLYVPSFFKALPCLHFMPFFQTFSCVPMLFSEFPSCNFLIFPTVSSISLVFPSLPFIFFLQINCFFHNCPPFSSMFPLFLTMFLHFPWFCPTFFLPFSRDLRRIEPHRHLIA